VLQVSKRDMVRCILRVGFNQTVVWYGVMWCVWRASLWRGVSYSSQLPPLTEVIVHMIAITLVSEAHARVARIDTCTTSKIFRS
jgi:hypothetical protein